MRCVTCLVTTSILAAGLTGGLGGVWALEGRHWSRDEITVEIGKKPSPGSPAPTELDPHRGLSQESLGLRESPLPQDGLPGAQKGSGKGTPANLLLGRKEIEENGALLAKLSSFGSNPSPMGISRVLDIMERYPLEFWGLMVRALEASEGGDSKALEALWQAVWVFREAGVMLEEDWDDLGYVLARIHQGAPVFSQPFSRVKGSQPSNSGAQGGGTKGDTSRWFGGFGSSRSPIGEIGMDKDLKGWGRAQDMGDGLMGWSDGEKGPSIGSRWVPLIDVGGKPDFQGPKTMGPDAGFYGGIDIGMLPGQAAYGDSDDMPETVRTALFRQWQYLKDKAEKSTGIMKEMLETMADIIDKKLTGKISDVKEFIVQGSESTLVIGEYGYTYWHNHSTGQVWEIIWGPVTTVKPPKKGDGGGGLPRPEGESEDPPVRDPQLLLKMTKAADREQNKPDVVPGVVDPVPIRGGDTAGRSTGGELAAAGAAKAEAAWKFSGKKPGSEVTDPAEWQTFKGEESSGMAKDLSLITDPAEPQAGFAGVTREASAMNEERNKASFAQALSQLMIMSIKAGAE